MKKVTTFKDGPFTYTDGGTRVSDGETTAAWGAVARSPDGRLLCLVWSLPLKHISRMQGPDSIPTTLLNSRVSLRRFLSLGPMALLPAICKHLFGYDPLARECLPVRITMQRIYSHAQNLGNVCADHAAALGVYGLISNQNIHTRWVHSSIDSRLYYFVYCMW